MAITFEQAVNGQEFHYGECTRTEGPRGGVKITREVWRRSGRTKTWKTRPGEFSIPVKHGMYTSGTITTHRAGSVHAAEDCPLLQKESAR